MPLLAAETKERFGYAFEELHPLSASLVAYTCDGCGAPGVRQRRRVKATWLCHLCTVKQPASARSIARRRRTMLAKYGVEHALEHPAFLAKAQAHSSATNLMRYGVEHAAQADVVKQKIVHTKLERYGTLNPQGLGKAESALSDWVASFGLVVTRHHVLATGQSLDVYVDALKVGIEYCGLYWHNELSLTPRLRGYHVGKMRAAAAEGIRLVTVFEDEWLHRAAQAQNALRSILGCSSTRLGARTCSVEPIDVDEAQCFLAEHHLQGTAPGVLYATGLRRGDELLAVLVLGRHHRQGHAACVLSRMCFANGVNVAGGASRMFARAAAWARESGFRDVITWSDNRWFDGRVYAEMGFDLGAELPPDYSYVSLRRPTTRLSKQSQQKRTTGCPPEVTEREWALRHGLARIWDCGHRRWVFALT